MQDAKLVIFAIIVVVVLIMIVLELLSFIRMRNTNIHLKKTLSKAINQSMENGTLDMLRPPNPVQIVFVLDTLRDFQRDNKTPEEFLEYFGLADDPFSRNVVLKTLQELLPATTTAE